ncbi:hypothetical protein Q5P01_022417 [Channa striata]|uniref:RING-type domain-containing protein n=1 Tax=Channa striata TaxID=64152 RepID=A0AA88J8U7_CHASR|nr:hypothetical protein Q5P01_022417 [Channa striata]
MAEAGGTGGRRASAPPDGTDPVPSEEHECKICYNDFDLGRHSPKLLDCSHTFCRECLDALHSMEGRGRRIGCPVCRQRTPVPENRVHNLPDNSAVAEALPLETSVSSSNTNRQTGAHDRSSSGGGCSQTCQKVAFTTGCVCAIFSFLSMVVLLFLGLIFVHNFNKSSSSVGPVCLFVASVLALVSLILTWLLCMMKYRPETGANPRRLRRNLAVGKSFGWLPSQKSN